MKEGKVLAAGPREQAMTAETMGEAYGVEVQMGTSATGEPLVVPVRRL